MLRKTTFISLLILQSTTFAADIKTDEQKYSYTVGYKIAHNLQKDPASFDTDAFIMGFTDVMNNKKTSLTNAEMNQALATHQQKAQQLQKKAANKIKETGQAFLAKNKTAAGIVTTESGLQYKIITKGTGPKPKATDSVKVHYRGTLISGKQFDSSYDRGNPAVFGVNRVIKGWTEALQLMPEGSKWKLFIPSDLAYGARSQGRIIRANETLIFDVELISVNPK